MPITDGKDVGYPARAEGVLGVIQCDVREMRLMKPKEKDTNWCWYPPDYPVPELSIARVSMNDLLILGVDSFTVG